jgi:hypothetical protein
MLRTVLPRTSRARTRVAVAAVPARVVPVLPATAALVALPPATSGWPGAARPTACWPGATPPSSRRSSSPPAGWSRSCGSPAPGPWPAGGARPPATPRRAPGGGAAPGRARPRHRRGRRGGVAAGRPAARLPRCGGGRLRPRGRRRPRRGHRGGSRGGLAAVWARPWGRRPGRRAPAGAGLEGDLTAWAGPLLGAPGRGSARLCLRLEPADRHRRRRGATIAAGAAWPLDYLLQAADDPSLLVPAADVWAHAGGRLPLGDRALADAQESLVRGLAEAARLVPPLAASLDEAGAGRAHLDAHGAGAFLADAATLSAAGIGVLLPAELTAGGQRRLRARLRARADHPAPGNERAGGLTRRTSPRSRGRRPSATSRSTPTSSPGSSRSSSRSCAGAVAGSGSIPTRPRRSPRSVGDEQAPTPSRCWRPR